MKLTNNNILAIMVFLDGLAAGLTIPMVSPHIMRNGGNQAILGVLAAGTFASRIVSQKFGVRTHGNFQLVKFSLTWSLIVYLLTYVALGCASSICVMIACRVIYTLMDGIKENCRQLGGYSGNSQLIDVTLATGMVLGSTLSGYLFVLKGNIVYNVIIAASLTVINLGLLRKLEEPNTRNCVEPVGRPTVSQIPQPVPLSQKLSSLRRIDYQRHWEGLLLKGAYTLGLALYFTKFPTLIKYNYHVGAVVVGHTVAYHQMLAFVAGHLTRWWGPSMAQHFNNVLFIFCLTLGAMCFAPSYECYLLLCIPVILTRSLADRYWGDALKQNGSQMLVDAAEGLGVMVGIGAPLVFGIILQKFERKAFYILLALPAIVGGCTLVRESPKIVRTTSKDEKQD